VVLAGELLVLAEDLLKNGLHCSEIIAGYTLSLKKAQEELDKCVCYTAPPSALKDPIELAKALKHVIAAKQYGNEDLFSAKIAEACVLAMPENETAFNTDNVRVAKIVGNSVHATTVVQGMCLTRGVLGTITDARDAKIAVYGIPLDSATTETKGTVLLKSAAELKAYSNSEEESLERVIKAIADAGTKMLICGQAVGELALHFIEKYGMMVMKCPSKFELRRICRTTGATNLVRMEPPAEADLGFCKHVHVKEIGSTQCTIFDHEQDNSKLATIVVRGSTSNIMDDVRAACLEEASACLRASSQCHSSAAPPPPGGSLDLPGSVLRSREERPAPRRLSAGPWCRRPRMPPLMASHTHHATLEHTTSSLYIYIYARSSGRSTTASTSSNR